MNPENDNEPLTPELRAAEYVLGTLDAEERVQLESVLAHDAALASEIAYWERRLAPLGLLQTPIEPPKHVWSRVQARTQARSTKRRRQGSGVWVGLAIAASMATFALASLLFVGQRPDPVTTMPQPAAPPVYASLIEDQAHSLAWLVTADSSPAKQLQIVAMGESYDQTWADRSLELWLLAPDEKPISLGLLPKEGVSQIPVSSLVANKLAQADTGKGTIKLAVSNEPLGGSPTGAPTGEVLFVVAVNKRDS